MSKKKRDKKIFEDIEIASAEGQPKPMETARVEAEQEALAPESSPENEEPTFVSPESSPVAEQSDQTVEDISPDDILADVRQSLIEDEAHDKEEKPEKWWRRIGKGSPKSTGDTEKEKPADEIEWTAPTSQSIEQEYRKEEVAPGDEYQNELDELIGLLDKEETAIVHPAPIVEETPPEPEKIIDIEELKKQAFQHRASEGDQNLSEVRAIALEGGEEVFVEVQTTSHDPLEERFSAVENALKPYRRYINFVFAFLGLVMAVIAAALLFNVYKQSLPEPTPEELSNLPFPTSVSLPGGWAFNLNRGSLVDGNWNPQGAEWLVGTEVCRWVALPWSRQLEAVIRTLNPDDPIGLGMSNSDNLVYKVYSVRRMSVDEMRELDDNSPCLLIVLAENGSEERWVLTALP